MPTPQTMAACGTPAQAAAITDVGPAADVGAIRMQMTGPLVPTVRIVGYDALAGWYGAGGGEELFRRDGRHWRFVIGGGGMMDAAFLHEHGVAMASACELAVDDVHCARSRRPGHGAR
jgi:hypothetical protein